MSNKQNFVSKINNDSDVRSAAADAMTTAVGSDTDLQAAILARIEDAIENEATTIALIDALIDAKVTAHIADCSAYVQAE